MRVSGGRARGIPLRVPRGASFRPAMDRLRQGVFSSLGSLVEGARFVDLFAGTGSYGLEALSRGAAGGVFVERDREAVGVLRSNLAAVCTSMGDRPSIARVSATDVFSWHPHEGEVFDLVFADPPFDDLDAYAKRLFDRVSRFLRVDPAGLLVLEMPGESNLCGPDWRQVRRIGKGRGQPTCVFFSRAAGRSGDLD